MGPTCTNEGEVAQSSLSVGIACLVIAEIEANKVVSLIYPEM